MMSHRFSRACAIAAAVYASLSGAALAATESHNFVNLDLTKGVEPSPEGQLRFSVWLIDTESAKKGGDTIQFDELELSPTWHTIAPKTSAQHLDARIVRYEVSCGWRSVRGLAGVAANTTAPRFFYSPRGGLLRADMAENLVIDRLCAGIPLDAARGAKSIDEAINLWSEGLGTNFYNAITVQHVLRTDATPYPLSWMIGEAPHSFVPIPTKNSSDNMLFLDLVNTKRDGDVVSASSLVVLGPQFSDRTFDPVVALRSVHYDCTSRTLTVLSQTFWNSFGDSIAGGGSAFGKRTATESPVTAADIHAACGAESSAAQTFATIEDAWSYARMRWPARPRPAWLSCIWEHFPEAVRTDYLTKWQDSFAGGAVAYAPSLPKPDASIATACGNAHPFQALIATYGIERAALGTLSSAHIDEAQLKSAFGALPLLEQRQYVKSHYVAGADNPQLDAVVLNAVTARLGIAPSDATARTALQRYLEADAKLDGNLS